MFFKEIQLTFDTIFFYLGFQWSSSQNISRYHSRDRSEGWRSFSSQRFDANEKYSKGLQMFVEIEAIGNKYIQIVLLISWNFELFTSQKNFFLSFLRWMPPAIMMMMKMTKRTMIFKTQQNQEKWRHFHEKIN